jgi:hypothetical protein
VLTPHVTEKMNLDFFSVNETNFLNTGIYNAGFFILNICQDVLDFLNWWKLRLLHFCFVQLERGLFVDQIWLNLVPLYFPNIFVLNNKGFNVAHWNLHERKISFSGNNYFVNEKIPLIFFHFSGLDVNDFNKISKYQNRFTIEERQDLLKLFTDYIKDIPFSPLLSDSLSVNHDVKENRIKLFLNYIIEKVRGK